MAGGEVGVVGMGGSERCVEAFGRVPPVVPAYQ